MIAHGIIKLIVGRMEIKEMCVHAFTINVW